MNNNSIYPKVVVKPWGEELWIELNDKYCYKRLFIKAGCRTSLHYHEHKVETNWLISGEAEMWLENEQGVIEKKPLQIGEPVTVAPPKKHRVVAVTDIIFFEVSTPEVDDVIRVEDDAARGSGRIDSEHTSH